MAIRERSRDQESRRMRIRSLQFAKELTHTFCLSGSRSSSSRRYMSLLQCPEGVTRSIHVCIISMQSFAALQEIKKELHINVMSR